MNLNFKKTQNIKFYKLFLFLILITIYSKIFYSQAIEYSGFGGKPAFPREDNPRTESIFIHTADPGKTIDEGIRVINNTNETKTFVVYAADYTKSTDGGFACKQYSQDKKGIGNWVILDKNEVTLYPMSEETIPFTINVPEDVEVGEHNGCILIQEKKPPSESAGISISVRTGLRVAITIPGEIIRKLSLSDILVKRKGLDKLTLSLSVSNTGNVSVDTDVKVRVSNLLDKEIIIFGGQYPIFRSDVATYNYDVKSPTFGSIYKAKGIVTYDGNAAAVIGETGSSNPITIETRPIYFIVFPTLKGLAIILSVIFFLIFLLLKIIIKKKRQKWIMKNWVQYKARKGDDINSLSDRYNVNWKLLAKTNKLRPPYIIKSGDILRVPPKMNGNKNTFTKNLKKLGKDNDNIISKRASDKIKSVKKPKVVNPNNIHNKLESDFNSKPNSINKPQLKPKSKPKPKTFTKSKPAVNKEPPSKPSVDEISSII